MRSTTFRQASTQKSYWSDITAKLQKDGKLSAMELAAQAQGQVLPELHVISDGMKMPGTCIPESPRGTYTSKPGATEVSNSTGSETRPAAPLREQLLGGGSMLQALKDDPSFLLSSMPAGAALSVGEKILLPAAKILESLPGLRFTYAAKLYEAGFDTVQKIADHTERYLSKIVGEDGIKAVKQWLTKQDREFATETTSIVENSGVSLNQVVHARAAKSLEESGYRTLGELSKAGITESQAVAIKGVGQSAVRALKEAFARAGLPGFKYAPTTELFRGLERSARQAIEDLNIATPEELAKVPEEDFVVLWRQPHVVT